ncbi:MAG: hypothetical protein IIX57_09185, partial [Lachnospiraceae bacterium]|nr:hypothetical protein [Lachnospiraceae bacterium]
MKFNEVKKFFFIVSEQIRPFSMDSHSRDTLPLQFIHLILHQRNERRNNNAQSIRHKRWQL